MVSGLTVPVIQDSAQLQTETGRRRISASPDAFGAEQARGAGALAQGLGEAAGHIDELAQRFDEANALDLDNQLSARYRQRLYDPQSGYLSTAMGRNAVDQRGQTEADLSNIADELASQASSPRAAALFRRQANARLSDALGSVATHAAQQTNAYEAGQAEARISEATNNAVAAFGSAPTVAANVDLATAEIQRVGHRLGWSDEQMQDRIRQVRSDINTRVITQLATSDPQAAEARYQAILPTLSAQDAGQLQTAMRVAQREYIDQVEGQGWQAFANGAPLTSIGADAYRELSTNPLLGQSHARLVEAYRNRAQSYASGDRARDNSPAFLAAQSFAFNNPREFMRAGALEQFMAAHAGDLSGSDMARLQTMRQQLRQNGQDIQSQQGAFTAIRGVAQGTLAPFGIDLSVSDRAPAVQRQRAAAFDAALLRAVQSYMLANGRPPAGDDVQTVIGQAVVGMHDADVQGLPQFRVQGDPGLSGSNVGVRATTEVVMPFDAIPQGARAQIASSLRARFHRNPTKGEVENEYAGFLLSQRDQ